MEPPRFIALGAEVLNALVNVEDNTNTNIINPEFLRRCKLEQQTEEDNEVVSYCTNLISQLW